MSITASPIRSDFLLPSASKNCCILASERSSTEPDWPGTHQIAHHDAIGVALANRDLVHADYLGRWLARSIELRLHILLVQLLDRVPVQMKFLGHVPHARRTA